MAEGSTAFSIQERRCLFNMRIREKRLMDYGVSESRERELIILAQQEENRGILEEAAEVSNSYLAPYLVRSLTSGRNQKGQSKVGYRTLFKYAPYPPCKEDDFYAYKRKTLAVFNTFLNGRAFGGYGKSRWGHDELP